MKNKIEFKDYLCGTLVHPKEAKRQYLYEQAFNKEQERCVREKILKDVLVMFNMLKNNCANEVVEKFITGDKIDLLEYNKQLEKELGLSYD